MEKTITTPRSKSKALSVLIADSDELFRSNLSFLLLSQAGVGVVAEADSYIGAVRKTRMLSPDLIIMTISLVPRSAGKFVETIKAASPKTRIAFITLHDQSVCRDLTELMQVARFIPKQSLKEEISGILEELSKDKLCVT